MTTSQDVRSKLVDLLRRDLIGPHPDLDHDLGREVLKDEKPSRWYVGGFLVPAYDGKAPATDDEDKAEAAEDDLLASETLDGPPRGGDLGQAAEEQDTADQPPKDRFLPSSIGLTVMLPEAVSEIELRATWGDYKTEPPLPDSLFLPEAREKGQKRPNRPDELHWVRIPGEATLTLKVTHNRSGIVVPGSSAPQRPGGGLEVQLHQRVMVQKTPEGTLERLRVVTVFLVNRRKRAAAPYTDISYAFQARIELACPAGFHPRDDKSTYLSDDFDLRLGDLHYRDVCEYAVGRNSSGGWDERFDENGQRLPVTRVWTDPMPTQEVEKVAPNTDIKGVEFEMEALRDISRNGAEAIEAALSGLPHLYGQWHLEQQALVNGLAPRRRGMAMTLLDNVAKAKGRIENGIALLQRVDHVGANAREAFAIMNEAMEMAARQREASIQKKLPVSVEAPKWRPFQLAFVLLNLVGLTERESPEREIVDLLFFPTGGGKTEAYLGLAAYSIALRRLRGSGVLGAGVSVIMRYTLRLLTLDQLGRAAGLVCALELIRTRDADGARRLGTWPIEIGLWVGRAASPNRLRPKGQTTEPEAATTWLNRYKKNPGKEKSPVPLKVCPWCYTPLTADSFRIHPSAAAPKALAIKCENPDCAFTRDRDLPVLIVDDTIYRRLPAFLIATMDKFAALPWEGRSGAFFGHVDRFDPADGFYGAAEPREGRPLGNGNHLDPPDLIIQDELHLISGPLGTVAGLYEAAIDLLASRQGRDRVIRPKIVASTATVRRAEKQIQALFDREETAVFPPPGIDRRHSFFAHTVDSAQEPARLYLGIASQGRGPKLLFLRSLQTLLGGSAALSELPRVDQDDPADPYLTVLAYFNALRELGGARRIVEDEIREHAASYGDKRQRLEPRGTPFGNRDLRQPLELTSRVSTDEVAIAKERLGQALKGSGGETIAASIDVALATNMISVGLDITRLGLMVVQGQPKTAAEYIQATSRVGRASEKPGLVVTLLNLHKPRDRTHYEQFRAFHASFYRAVEATSVTPFAPRALDRALAALVVAACRHLDADLTPQDGARRLQDYPQVKQRVREAVRARATSAGVDKHLVDRAVERTNDLFVAWERIAEEQGRQFGYDDGAAQRRLLQRPLDPDIDILADPDHHLFTAARSMRDVEHGAFLKAADPWGKPIVE